MYIVIQPLEHNRLIDNETREIFHYAVTSLLQTFANLTLKIIIKIKIF